MKLPAVLYQLDKHSLVPLYKQLRDALGQTLQRGQWDADTPLPSERDLSEALQLSRATVRQALQTLEADGWLVRQQGRGTFPAPAKVEQPLSMVKGFTEDMRQAGFETTTKFLSGVLEPALGRGARVLNMSKNSLMAVTLRLRFVGDQPLMLERTHLNYTLTPGILEQDLTGSLYEILKVNYGLKFVHGEEIIEAIKAEPWLARLLGIKSGAPILYTQRIISNEKNQVFEYTERFARADKTSFRATLEGDHTKIAYNDEMKVKKPLIKPPMAKRPEGQRRRTKDV